MKVYDLKDSQGMVFAFEVENSVLRRDELCRVVSGIPGATLLRQPLRLSYFRESEFCEFELDGVRFSADEGPWGDDDRYRVGPTQPHWVPQVEAVRQAFLNHQPSSGPVRLPFVLAAIAAVLVTVVVWALANSR
jgi:hypothetical protein